MKFLNDQLFQQVVFTLLGTLLGWLVAYLMERKKTIKDAEEKKNLLNKIEALESDISLKNEELHNVLKHYITNQFRYNYSIPDELSSLTNELEIKLLKCNTMEEFKEKFNIFSKNNNIRLQRQLTNINFDLLGELEFYKANFEIEYFSKAYKEAEDYLNKALRLNSTDADVNDNLLHLYYVTFLDYKKTIQWCDILLTKSLPCNLQMALEFAFHSALRVGLYEKAKFYYQRLDLTSLIPSSLIQIEIGYLLITDNTEGALQKIQDYKEVYPANENLLLYEALLNEKKGNFINAEHLIKEALRINPNCEILKSNLIHYFIKNKNYVEANKLAKSIYETSKTNIEYLVNYSNILIEQNKLDDAINLLHSIDTSIYTHRLERLLNNIAYAQFLKGEYIEALSNAELAIFYDDKYPNAYVIKAQILFKLNKYNECLDSFEKSILLNPNDCNVNALYFDHCYTIYGKTIQDDLITKMQSNSSCFQNQVYKSVYERINS